VRNAYKVFDGNLRVPAHSGDLCAKWKVLLLRQILKNLEWFVLGQFAIGYRAMMSMYDHSNEPLGTITNSMELSP
jgi:hypothetical protein